VTCKRCGKEIEVVLGARNPYVTSAERFLVVKRHNTPDGVKCSASNIIVGEVPASIGPRFSAYIEE
jgi:hypothetical protein